MDSTSPPSSSNSFPVPVAVAVGFVATAAVLIGYYLFVLRFWLNGHHPGLRQVTPYSRRGRNREDDGGGDMPPAFFIDEHDGGGGVDPSIVNSIPIIKFIKSGGQILECAVCLSEFQEEESLKLLPSCSHAFHIQCIDTWLKTNANCPLCRANVSKPIQMPVLASISQQLLSSEQVLTPVADDEASNQTPGDRNWCRISKVESMRDVSIEFREPIRRSFSMDHLHLNDHRKSLGESSISVRGGGDGSGRFRRLFGLGRSSRNAVLPIQIDQ